MKARIKGSKKPFEEVEYVILKNSYYVTRVDQVEFEQKTKEEENDFIEKAIGWIDYNNREGGCFFTGWEKDFRKYMKGE